MIAQPHHCISGAELHRTQVTRLYPKPCRQFALKGLYLRAESRVEPTGVRPIIYSNFVASLDGRVAVAADGGRPCLPLAIANARDWYLFEELIAQADMLLVSARYMRELAAGTNRDIFHMGDVPEKHYLYVWRKTLELCARPALTILSTDLDIPPSIFRERHGQEIYIATGRQARDSDVSALERLGARVLFVGDGQGAQGRPLIQAITDLGFRRIYSVAGPRVLATLVKDRVLDRLYLTQAHRFLGGRSYHTVFEGSALTPPHDMNLRALYYDPPTADSMGQTFGVYDTVHSIAEV